MGFSLAYMFQKCQAIYPEKRSLPTSTMYMDFNMNNYKGDKVIGGVINLLFIGLFLCGNLYNATVDWWQDRKPYESSVTNPFSTEGQLAREKLVKLAELSTFFFYVESRTGQTTRTLSYEEIEQYIGFELIHV